MRPQINVSFITIINEKFNYKKLLYVATARQMNFVFAQEIFTKKNLVNFYSSAIHFMTVTPKGGKHSIVKSLHKKFHYLKKL